MLLSYVTFFSENIFGRRFWPFVGIHLKIIIRPLSAQVTFPQGRYSWNFLVGKSRPVLQILNLFQTKKCRFRHPFLGLASKIHIRFQTWRSRHELFPLHPFRICILLFCSYSFAIETTTTSMHSRNSLENHTRFQTQTYGRSLYSFSDRKGAKTILLGRHIPISLKYGNAPGSSPHIPWFRQPSHQCRPRLVQLCNHFALSCIFITFALGVGKTNFDSEGQRLIAVQIFSTYGKVTVPIPVQSELSLRHTSSGPGPTVRHREMPGRKKDKEGTKAGFLFCFSSQRGVLKERVKSSYEFLMKQLDIPTDMHATQ